VRRPRAEEILGEWGVRDVTPPSQHERDKLAAEAELNAHAGKPLPRRVRLGRTEADRYFASLGGPLPYMQRLRRIDEETAEHERRLAAAYARHQSDPERWRRIVERWSFGAVNELIDAHNRWYPIEASLPMSPRLRDYVDVGGKPYRRPRLDVEWVLDRFPA
jgi:hypothetical protein